AGGVRADAGLGCRPGACIGACSRFGCRAGFGAEAGFRSGNRAGTFADPRFDGRAGLRARICLGSGGSAGHRDAVIGRSRVFIGSIRARIGIGAVERIACNGDRQPRRIVRAVRRERPHRELIALPYRRARPHAAQRDGTPALRTVPEVVSAYPAVRRPHLAVRG
ncbi:hypothetical protein QZM15_05045, partial [Burkholderia sp. AU44665]|uniref:hypothetical protein n=1 Tax=Burkholderia sp. AU44665 TaxID=3059203 RepID=UPI002660448F